MSLGESARKTQGALLARFFFSHSKIKIKWSNHFNFRVHIEWMMMMIAGAGRRCRGSTLWMLRNYISVTFRLTRPPPRNSINSPCRLRTVRRFSFLFFFYFRISNKFLLWLICTKLCKYFVVSSNEEQRKKRRKSIEEWNKKKNVKWTANEAAPLPPPITIIEIRSSTQVLQRLLPPFEGMPSNQNISELTNGWRGRITYTRNRPHCGSTIFIFSLSLYHSPMPFFL